MATPASRLVLYRLAYLGAAPGAANRWGTRFGDRWVLPATVPPPAADGLRVIPRRAWFFLLDTLARSLAPDATAEVAPIGDWVRASRARYVGLRDEVGADAPEPPGDPFAGQEARITFYRLASE